MRLYRFFIDVECLLQNKISIKNRLQINFRGRILKSYKKVICSFIISALKVLNVIGFIQFRINRNKTILHLFNCFIDWLVTHGTSPAPFYNCLSLSFGHGMRLQSCLSIIERIPLKMCSTNKFQLVQFFNWQIDKLFLADCLQPSPAPERNELYV